MAANLAGAMEHLLGQALEHEFPGAPYFETEVKSGTLKKVYELVLPATQSPDGRVAVDKTLRTLLRQIANPLLLGEMGMDATHFVLSQHWKTHFDRRAADSGSPTITVGQLRGWIDDPKPTGLPKEAENLVILLFAAQTNRTFYRHGGPYDPTLPTLPDDCELRTVHLPPADQWDAAVKRAGSVFGVASSRLLSAANVGMLSAELKKKAEMVRRPCQTYCRRLQERMKCLGIVPENTDRVKTAVATLAIVEKLHAAEPTNVIGLLAKADIATSEAAMGECVGKAAELEGNLGTAGWDIFEAIGKLGDERKAAAEAILAEVQQAISSDEHVMALAPTLTGAQARAVRLLTKAVEIPQPKPGVVTPPLNTPVQPLITPGKRVVGQGTKQDLSAAAAKDF